MPPAAATARKPRTRAGATAPARRKSGPARSPQRTSRPRPAKRTSAPSRKSARPAAGTRARRAARSAQPGIDRVLRGRAYIAVVFALLTGIVFFNVTLFELNSGIARTNERAGLLKRQNARLRLHVARLGSSERIQEEAAKRGFVLPAPGEVRYLRANPRADGRAAARRIRRPEPQTAPPPEPAIQQPQNAQTPAGATAPTAAQPTAPPATAPHTEHGAAAPVTDAAPPTQIGAVGGAG